VLPSACLTCIRDDRLTDTFATADAQQMRKQANLDTEGTSRMLRVWVHRGYISFNDETQQYEKTEKYKRGA
ncbi:MAG: hypothetical protein MJZ95_03510, partial [Paludibacteraceae bacterium]|nr:hypothetical protein [Paludibacteraceae bacterium]